MLDDYRPLLEEKGFRVEIRPTDETVFADRRGLCFLLGQVVSNSVKYALEKPVLTFSLESNDTATVLSIRDNGPGVRACDLPYVFEKGFTGDSGHEKNKATGMGLYLARELFAAPDFFCHALPPRAPPPRKMPRQLLLPGQRGMRHLTGWYVRRCYTS